MMYQNQNELCHPSINVGIYFSLTCWMTFRDKRRVDVKYSFVTLSIVLPHCGYPWYQCPVFSVLGSSQFSGPGGVEDKWWPRSLCQSLSLYPGWQHPPERLLQRLESGRGHYQASDSLKARLCILFLRMLKVLYGIEFLFNISKWNSLLSFPDLCNVNNAIRVSAPATQQLVAASGTGPGATAMQMCLVREFDIKQENAFTTLTATAYHGRWMFS